MRKTFIKTLSIAMVTFGLNLSAHSQSEFLGSRLPSEIVVDKTYGNHGDVELFLNGIFPNGCYEKAETLVEAVQNEIFIKNRIAFNQDRLCTMALVPYSDSVQIHNLESGKYTVFVKDKKGNYQQTKSFYIN